jgi:quercetin 2,3-dioxygenase
MNQFKGSDMINIRRSVDRGQSKSDWLMSMHTFSFADYYAPECSGFGALRVINDDIIQPGKGFGMHAHHNMEILTYVIDGVLEHKDSLGTGSHIVPGEIQRMSAGHGVQHSEFNPSPDKELRLLQIWIHPNTADSAPSYEQKSIRRVDNSFILIGAERGDSQVVALQQDVKVFVAYLTKDNTLDYSLDSSRRVWVQLIKGHIQLNQKLLCAGDGAAVVDETRLHIIGDEDAELLLFDLVN